MRTSTRKRLAPRSSSRISRDGEITVARAFEPLNAATIRQPDVSLVTRASASSIPIKDDTIIKSLKKDPRMMKRRP